MCYCTSFLFHGCGHIVQSTEPIPNAPPCPQKSQNRMPGAEYLSFGTHSSHDKSEQSWPSPEQIETVSLTWHGRSRNLAALHAAGLPIPGTRHVVTRQNKTPDSGYSTSFQSTEPVSPQSNAETHPTSRSSSRTTCEMRTSHPLHTFRVNALCNRCELDRQRKIAIFEVKMIAESVERSLGRCSSERMDGMTSVQTPSKSRDSRMSMVSVMGESRKRRRVIEGSLEGCENGEGKKRGVIPFRTGTNWHNFKSDAAVIEEPEEPTPNLGVRDVDMDFEMKHEVDPDTIQQQPTPPPEVLVDEKSVDTMDNTSDPTIPQDMLRKHPKGMDRIIGWANFY